MKALVLGASLRPPTNSLACFVKISAQLPPTIASTVSLWEWIAPFTALTAWSLLRTLVLVRYQACYTAYMKLHAHSVQYAYKIVSKRHALEKTYVTSQRQGQEMGIASHIPDAH